MEGKLASYYNSTTAHETFGPLYQCQKPLIGRHWELIFHVQSTEKQQRQLVCLHIHWPLSLLNTEL